MEDAPAELIDLGEPPTGADFRSRGFKPIGVQQFEDAAAEANQSGQIAEHMEDDIVLSWPMLQEQLVDAGEAFHRLRALEWDDEHVRRVDGVLHDRRDLVRAVDDRDVVALTHRRQLLRQ